MFNNKNIFRVMFLLLFYSDIFALTNPAKRAAHALKSVQTGFASMYRTGLRPKIFSSQASASTAKGQPNSRSYGAVFKNFFQKPQLVWNRWWPWSSQRSLYQCEAQRPFSSQNKFTGSLALAEAVKSGSREKVQDLIKRGLVNIYERYEGGDTILHIAARENASSDILSLLIEAGPNLLHAKNGINYTPLHVAAAYGRLDAVKTLIAQGANPNAITESHAGSSYTSSTGYANVSKTSHVPSLFKHLLSKISLNKSDDIVPVENLKNQGTSPLYLVQEKDQPSDKHLEIIKFLKPITDRSLWFVVTPDVELRRAIVQNNINQLKQLLTKHTFNIDALNEGLRIGARGSKTKEEVFEILLKAGGNIYARNSLERTLLHLSALYGNLAAVKLFLEKRVDHRALDYEGKTALDLAKKHPSNDKDTLEIIKILTTLEPQGYRTLGKKMSLADELWLLGAAIESEKPEALQKLLNEHVFSTEALNESLLRAARGSFRGRADMAGMLLDAGAAINTQSFLKKTPLHYAAQFSNPLTVTLLLKKGANPNALDDEGRAPLYLAQEHDFLSKERLKVIEILKPVTQNRFWFVETPEVIFRRAVKRGDTSEVSEMLEGQVAEASKKKTEEQAKDYASNIVGSQEEITDAYQKVTNKNSVYAILGADTKMDKKELEVLYKNWVRHHHPDRYLDPKLKKMATEILQYLHEHLR